MRPEPDWFAVLDEILIMQASLPYRIIADVPHDWIAAYVECNPEKTEAIVSIASPFVVPPQLDQDVETLIRSLLLGRELWKPSEAFRMPSRWLGMPWIKPLLDEFGVQTLENPDDSKMAAISAVSFSEVRRLQTAESLSAFLNWMDASSLGRRLRWSWKQVLSGRASSDLIDSLASKLSANLPVEPDENAFTVFSPSTHADSWMTVSQVPSAGFGLFNEIGESIPFQTIETKNGPAILFRFQSDGIGFRAFRFKPVQNETPRPGLTAGRFFLENDRIRVDVRPNGLVDVTDKTTDNRFRGLNAPSISDKSIKPSSVRLSLVESGPLRGAVKIRMRLKPQESRHGSTEVVKIWSTVRLGMGDRHIEFETEIENPFEESVSLRFPTDCITRQSRGLVGFGQLSHESIRVTRRGPDESHAYHGIVWVMDENRSLALITDRPGSYSLKLDSRRTIRLESGKNETEPEVRKYGFVPFDPKDDVEGRIAFNVYQRLTSTPLAFEGLALKGDPHGIRIEPESIIATLKEAADGRGVILRLWNPTTQPVHCRIESSFDFSEAWRCGLQETQFERLQIKKKSLGFDIKAERIDGMRLFF